VTAVACKLANRMAGIEDKEDAARAWEAACGEGDVARMQRLLSDSPDPSAMMMDARWMVGKKRGGTALMETAFGGHVGAMNLLLQHPCVDAAAMMMLASEDGSTALMLAAGKGHGGAMRCLLDHPRADAAAMIVLENRSANSALYAAALSCHVDCVLMLLDHPSVNAAALIMRRNGHGNTVLTYVACYGYVDAMRMLLYLDHPSVDPAALMMLTETDSSFSAGISALMLATWGEHVDAMRLLLDHRCADAAAMMMHTDDFGRTALFLAAQTGCVDACRLLMEHPSASAAMMASTDDDHSVLIAAAKFAAGVTDPDDWDPPATIPSCAPLLFLLRRVAVDPQACDAQQEHMTKVMEVLSQRRLDLHWDVDNDDEPQQVEVGPLSVDQPDSARDECVRLMFEHGAGGYDPNSPVIRRIIREYAQLARVPQLLNLAVVGLAIERQ
jgi:ankyrin repeat protein